MILSYQTIKRFCKTHKMIYPCKERTIVRGMSYGLGPCSYDFRIDQNIDIYPGEFKLCSTVEKVKIPDFIAARVCDKSTWARLGVMVQNTHFDPGFEGYPTIELTNHSNYVRHIKKGMPICQFVFEILDEITEKPYNGKYQNQAAKPIRAKLEKVKSKAVTFIHKKEKASSKGVWTLEKRCK